MNADFESGFAADPQGVAQSVRMAIDTGVAGLSIEDSTGDADHPLYDCETALLMPHVGSGTHATRARMSRVACENIKAALEGDRPKFLVNPEAWEKRRK